MRTGHHVCDLANLARAGLGVAADDVDLHRIRLVALGDGVDARRHRGREQHGLVGVGDGLEDALDVVGEAHVEHLVGLVEHQHPNGVERQRTATDVVDDAAGGADDDVHATVECLQLAVDGLAAVDGHALGAHVLAVAEERFTDLHGQLAGGHQHECHRLVAT